MRTILRKRLRKWLAAQENAVSAYTRWTLLQPGFTRLLIAPVVAVNGDPLLEWKRWGDRVSKKLGRLPGNWRTRRGIKKRKRALMSVIR